MKNFKNLLKRNKGEKNEGGGYVCFGVPLEELAARTKNDVPLVVDHVIKNLEDTGMLIF